MVSSVAPKLCCVMSPTVLRLTFEIDEPLVVGASCTEGLMRFDDRILLAEYSKSAAVQQNKRKAPASEDDLDPSWEVKGKRSKKTKFSAKELAEEASFVQCEVCGKWRLLPIGTQASLPKCSVSNPWLVLLLP